MFIGVFICASIFLSTLVGGKAWGQLQSGNHAEIAKFRASIHVNRKATNWFRQVKCRSPFRWRYVPVSTYPLGRLQGGLNRVRTLRREARQSASACPTIHHLSLWLCVHAHEGRWDDPNDPYFGGLQMGRWFMGTYGASLYRTKGTADNWTPAEQMAVADRAYHNAGHSSAWLNGQWPGTRSECGA